MMTSSYQYTPYIWPMVTAIGLTAAVGIYSWRHRSVPGAAGTRMRPLGTSELTSDRTPSVEA